jgi:hypothetical protein
MAGLGVPLVLTLGCDRPNSAAPTFRKQPELRAMLLSSVQMSPTRGASTRTTVATIEGFEFQSGTTVTVDGTRVDATVLDASRISLVMPAHAPGKVDVAVIRAPGQTPVSVPYGYTYVGPPIISQMIPNIGSTLGGTPVWIAGTDVYSARVTVDGVVISFEWDWPTDEISGTMPAHTAGPVEVILTDEYGQTASTTFTYASPDTFEINGEWQGWAYDSVARESRRFQFTIRDNRVVSVSCHDEASVTLVPTPVVANGEFSFAGSDGVSVSGRILSPISAAGSVNLGACRSRPWSAEK